MDGDNGGESDSCGVQIAAEFPSARSPPSTFYHQQSCKGRGAFTLRYSADTS